MSSRTEPRGDELDELVVEARRRAGEMAARRAALREDVLKRVVRWQWASFESKLHRFEPLVREREDFRSRKLLPGPPGEYEHAEQYGYDERGRIVVARETHNPARSSPYREELIRHHDQLVESWTYWSNGEPLWVRLFRSDEHGRLRFAAEAGVDDSLHTEIYLWEGDRAVEIRSVSDSPAHGGITMREVEEVEYDDAGHAAAIYSTWQSSEGSRDRHIVWRARSAGPSAATLARRIGESLRAHLVQAVRAGVPFAPWAAVLYYGDEQPLRHGSLVITGAAVREHFEAQTREAGDDEWARLALWNPAEWLSSDIPDVRQFWFDELASDLSDLIAEYEAMLAGEDEVHSDGVKIIRRVAKRLYADLSEALDVAPGFVAYPLDLELTELPKGLKAIVPRDVFAGYEDLLP